MKLISVCKTMDLLLQTTECHVDEVAMTGMSTARNNIFILLLPRQPPHDLDL